MLVGRQVFENSSIRMQMMNNKGISLDNDCAKQMNSAYKLKIGAAFLMSDRGAACLVVQQLHSQIYMKLQSTI